jgi:predicted flap endonuclease-1-like 5' DNA nuclease
MRTAPSRVRRLLGLLAVAASVGWLLLRRRTGAALPLPAIAPTPPSAPPAPAAPVMATVAAPAAPDVLATDAGLTAEPAAPAPEPVVAAEPATPDLLATDAGLTAEPAAPAEPGEPAASAGSGEDTIVLPRPVDPDAPAPAGTDNLRAIRGIGPAIERTLHELGITTYQQVADLRGEQTEAVRRRLEAFSARIEREDWVGQAQELHRRKYGD